MDSGGNEKFILASTFDKRRDIFLFFFKGNLNPLELDGYCVSVWYKWGADSGVAIKIFFHADSILFTGRQILLESRQPQFTIS